MTKDKPRLIDLAVDAARDHETLMELLTGLELAVSNARDYDTLISLIGDATERALAISRGGTPAPRLRSTK
jgi:hypothetical protein